MKKKYIIIAISLVIVTLLIVCGNVFAVKNVNVVFENNTDKTTEFEILEAAGIDDGLMIFNLRENEIKSKVAKHYKDNSIVVTNIVRKFPNIITLYVKERIPIFKISVYSQTNTNAFVPVDKDFQMGTITTQESNNYLIQVNNLVVKDTFDLKECAELRTLANSLIEVGIKEEALPYFIEYINFTADFIKVKLRNSNATLSVKRTDVGGGIKILYSDYLVLDEQTKLDCHLINS